MKIKFTLIGLFISVLGFAQDFHWSNSNLMRAIVNPAENATDTGLDASLIYRNQWKSVMTPFSTTGINVNSSLPKGFGIGITLIDDKAGSVGWHRTNAMLNVNYGLLIKQVKIRIGAGFGFDNYAVNPVNAIFPDQINPDLTLGQTAEIFNHSSLSRFDNTLGLFASIPIAKKSFNIGASYNHFLVQKSVSFFGYNFKEYNLLNVQATMALPINTNWTAKPYVNYQNQGSFNQVIIGSTYHYSLQQNEFFTGLSYRLNDALIGQAGFFIKNIKAGISYDYTISSIRSNAGGTGAVELFAGYHFRKKETDKLDKSITTTNLDASPTPIEYTAIVVNNITSEPLTDYSFTLKDLDKNLVVLEKQDLAISEIKSSINPCTKYELTVSKQGYLTKTKIFNIPCDASIIALSDTIGLEPLELNKNYELNNIYYDYDKTDLTDISKIELEKLFALLSANPTMVIELASHTDNKGTEEYNQTLSEQRAQSCVNHLIKLGIDASRLQAKGYGESAPIAANENEDGSDNVDGRAKNRRTEFKIISF